MTRATIEFRVDRPEGKQEEMIIFELDPDHVQAFLGAYKNFTDDLRVLAEKPGVYAKIINRTGWTGKTIDWLQRTVKAFRN